VTLGSIIVSSSGGTLFSGSVDMAWHSATIVAPCARLTSKLCRNRRY
jgi:hypothetical protein